MRRHGEDADGDQRGRAAREEERQGFGRLLATVTRGRRYDWAEMTLARGVWGDVFPDVIGGLDPDDAIAKFTYEPIYGQMLTASDPRSRAAPTRRRRLRRDRRTSACTSDALPIRHVYRGPTANPGSDPTRLLGGRPAMPTPTLPDGSVGGAVV